MIRHGAAVKMVALLLSLLVAVSCAAEFPSNRSVHYRVSTAVQTILAGRIPLLKDEDRIAREKYTYPNEMLYIDAAEEIIKKGPVSQQDASLLSILWQIHAVPKGLTEMMNLIKEWNGILALREHVKTSVEEIGVILLGPGTNLTTASQLDKGLTPYPWDCIRSMESIFKTYCGPLICCGVGPCYEFVPAFAILCKAEVGEDQMAPAAKQVCPAGRMDCPSF